MFTYLWFQFGKTSYTKYIVFYNDTAKHEPIEKLKLSDAFMTDEPEHEFEWTATMINLNEGKNDELLSKCKALSDYMKLINKINYYKKKFESLREAAELAINECIEENVLADFCIFRLIMHTFHIQ